VGNQLRSLSALSEAQNFSGYRASLEGLIERRDKCLSTSAHDASESRPGRSRCEQALQHQWHHCPSTYPHKLGTRKQAVHVQGEFITPIICVSYLKQAVHGLQGMAGVVLTQQCSAAVPRSHHKACYELLNFECFRQILLVLCLSADIE
jgi:hypothetical protein